MINILDLDFEELENFFIQELHEKPYRAKQVWSWLWQKGVQDFSEMTNVSQATREKLSQMAQITWPKVLNLQTSTDGTKKFLLELADGACIESVLIPSFGPHDLGGLGEEKHAKHVSSFGDPKSLKACKAEDPDFDDYSDVFDEIDDFDDDFAADFDDFAADVSNDLNNDSGSSYKHTQPKRGKMLRYALCISSQVGCAMGCTFCHTAKMGFVRNLTPAEILGQLQVARHHLGDNRPDKPIIRNLVFMGMGEPLLNFKNLKKALSMAHHKLGLAFSARRITVSTCGIKQGLLELGNSNLAFLAISLHAPNQELRSKLMPKAANWQLSDLLTTLKDYPLKARELITFEYLLLGGVNDSPAQALELAKLVQQAKGKLNLIAFNPIGESPYKAPSPETILAFEKVLWSRGVTAILRKSKGQDISAACGQLHSEVVGRKA